MAPSRIGRVLSVLLLTWAGHAVAQDADPCARSRLGELVLDLFPPASAEARLAAVEKVSECKTAAVVGLLEQKVFRDGDPAVRVAAVHALAANPTPEAEAALRKASGFRFNKGLLEEIDRALASRSPPPAGTGTAQGTATSQGTAATQGTPTTQGTAAAGTGTQGTATLIEKRPATPPRTTPRRPSEPSVPFDQRDGLAFSVTTSALAGGTLMPFLAALAQQKNPLTLTLTSAAGAIIGGGSAWGLSLFGMRQRLPQAIWYTNSTAWGTLAGVSLHSGLIAQSNMSPEDKDRALWGMLAAGETVGLATGIWSASMYEWTPQQIVFADGLLIGSFLAYGGTRLLQDQPFDVTAPISVATIPVMVGSAVAARYLDPSPADLYMVSAASLASAWTGFLFARPTGTVLTRDMHAFGGVLVGSGAGFLASVAASPFVEIEPSRSWGPLGFMLAGNAFGLGTHMVLQPLDERGMAGNDVWTVGAAIGGLAFGAGAVAAWPYLKFGPHAPDLTFAGAAYGSLTWFFATAAADTGVRRPEDPIFVGGGMLAGGAALATVGLVSSQWLEPTPWDHLVTATSTLAGMGVGLGTARLAAPEPGQRGLPDLAGVIAGSAAGFAAGAYAEHRKPLSGTDYVAGLAGGAYGTMAGALVPTLANEEWISSSAGKALRQERIVGASAMLGAGAAAAVAATASHVTGARRGQVALPAVATMLGSGMGLGLGMMLDASSRGPRIGTLAGSTALLATSIATDPWLKLSEGLGPSALQLGAVGTGLGFGYGLLFAQLPETPSSSTGPGGALFGATAGLATGLVTSKYVELPPGGVWTLAAYPLLGGLFGNGFALLTTTTRNPIASRRAYALEAIGGATLGTVGAAFQNRYAPLEGTDGLAGLLGAGYGTFFGAMAPTLGDRTWPQGIEAQRAIWGSTLMGLSAGALSSAIARRATGVRPRTVWSSALGGVDGLLMGLGFGLLVSPADGSSSQPERIGMVAGTATGLAIGAAAWPSLTLNSKEVALLRTSTVVLGWTGLWAPTLGEPSLGLAIQERALGKRMWGGVLAGLGVGSFGATLAAPALRDLDEDLLNDGLLLYLIGNGAGAGAGALLSERDDVPAAAMLGTGVAAFAAGALLHDRVDFRKSTPLLLGFGIEGAWLGAWTSVLLSTAPEGQPLLSGVSSRMFWGGSAAGLLTGVGVAALLGEQPEWPMRRTGVSLLGSATLASITSGLMIMSPSIQNRLGAGIVTGASAAGFALGAYLSPQLELSNRTFWISALGAGLGIAEGSAFAWASESTDSNQYLGASLVGMGIGTAQGLAVSAAAGTAAADIPAELGLSAWGAWVGSFSGSLFFVGGRPDVRRVTFGGLVGLNAGFLVGLGLLRTGVIQSRDIGWLSLFGGAGTLLGAGVTAPFSSGANPGPVLAGLAAGPVVGMVAGVIIWPRIRGTVQPAAAELVPGSETAPSSIGSAALALFQVKDWQPVFTVLPSPSGRESTILIGAQGTLW